MQQLIIHQVFLLVDPKILTYGQTVSFVRFNLPTFVSIRYFSGMPPTPDYNTPVEVADIKLSKPERKKAVFTPSGSLVQHTLAEMAQVWNFLCIFSSSLYPF